MAGRWTGSLVVAALCAAALAGCDREDVYWRALDAEGAYVTNGAYFAWDTARRAFVRVDLDDAPGARHAVTWQEVVGDAHHVQVSPTGDALLVLTPDERALSVLPADGSTPRVYELDQPFDSLTVSDDGRFVVAYASAGASGGAVAIGENLLAVVDLDAAPGDGNPRSRTVSSYGGERLGIDISPGFTVDGGPRRVAVIRSVGHVALLDLVDPAAEAIGVPLVVPGDPVDLRPQAARFAPQEADRGGLWVLLWAAGNGDVIALDVGAAPAGEAEDAAAGATGLRATLNQHAVGGWVTDAVPVTDASGRLLVAALSSPGRLLALIDVESGETRTFTFDTSFGRIEQFLVEQDGADGPVERPYVLLSGAETRHFAVLAVDEVPQKGAKAMRLRSLRRAYDSIAPIPDAARFVAYDDDRQGFTLVWLEREAAEDSFAFAGSIQDSAFSADGTLLHLLVGSSGAGGHLVNVRLSDGAIAELPLDGGVVALRVVPDSGRLVIVHDDPTGLLTYVAPDALERPLAERIFGFLLDGMLGADVLGAN